MGLLDDAATVISTRSHTRRSKGHRSSRHHRQRSKSRSRSRSRSRHRSSRSTVSAGGWTSFFGGGGDDDDDALSYGNYNFDDERRNDYYRRESHRDRDRSRDRSRGGERSRRSSKDDDVWSMLSGLLPDLSRSSFLSNFIPGTTSSHRSSSSYYKRSPRRGYIQRLLKKLRRLLRDIRHHVERHPLRYFFLVLMPLITGGALTAILARFGLRLPPYIEKWLGVAAKSAGVAAGGGSAAAASAGLNIVGEAVKAVSGGKVGRGAVNGWERKLEKEFRNGVGKILS